MISIFLSGKKAGLLFLLCALSFFSYSQNAWNANNFKISKDSANLEDMAGAVPLTFSTSSPNVTDTIAFPNGFVFKFGETAYTCFSACDDGYIRLGGKIQTIYSHTEPNIIGAFVDGFFYNVVSGWKVVGIAPYRKLVIEWAGTFYATSQNIKYQLWLNETTGKIDIVHSGINSFASNASNYEIFCHTQIGTQNALVAIVVQNDGNGTAVANYTSTLSCNAKIPANTKYTFAPDTARPVRPGIVFSNIQPGCFTVAVKDSSNNESKLFLEKMKAPGIYTVLSQQVATDAPGTGTLYAVNEANLQPDSVYTYRAYATNGFVHSDTTIVSLRTPAALLSGVKRIPGDYPSVNALLSDALCKQVYGQLIIELQNDYSFAAENGSIQFLPALSNKFIQGITIRPAANVSSLLLTNSANIIMLLVDSVNFVTIDGRPGGTGSAGVLTFRQSYNASPAVAYINGAGYGNVQYIKFEGNNYSYGILHTGTEKPGATYNGQKAASNMLIRNCAFGPLSGTALLLSGIGGNNNIIRDNEFSRFGSCAVLYKGGTNCRIAHNRFYRPEFVSNTSTYGVIDASSVGENFMVDSNRIGGSVAAWGQGLWKQSLSIGASCTNAIIKVTSAVNSGNDFMAYIRGNEIANMQITGDCSFRSIYAKGSFSITGNRIGTNDSTGSISTEYTQAGIFAESGYRAFVENNFISGLKASSASMISINNMDTIIIKNNDVGGSDNYLANVFNGGASGISWSGASYGLVRNNTVRGISSATGSVLGIGLEYGYYTPVERSANVDSNSIHHLDGRGTIMGLFLNASTSLDNTIINNKIYALKGRGPSDGQGANDPTKCTGIEIESFALGTSAAYKDTGVAIISGNQLYAFDYSTPEYYYIYPMTGIRSEGHNVRINNNFISLGINSRGQSSDSTELECTGIWIAQSQKPAYIEHNSILIAGKGNFDDEGIHFTTENFSNGLKNIYVSNNIISLNRKQGGLGDNKYYMPYTAGNNSNVAANKNIWYSDNDTAINSKLQLWKSVCKCDSLSFVANPLFINAYGDSISQNLHLLPGSPAEAAGLPPVQSVITDIDGQLRQSFSPHDIGADAAVPCPGSSSASIQLNTVRRLIEFCATSPVLLTATVNGSITNLQWQKNLNNIPGATGTNVYTITQPGSYRLVGQTACGAVASPSVMFVQGITAPTGKIEPAIANASYCDGDSARFNVPYNTNTDYPVQFEWYKDHTLLPGKITASEVIEDLHNNELVSVKVKNITPCGTFTTTLEYTLSDINPSTRPQINIQSFQDTLYSVTNRDILKYDLTGAPDYYPQVIYLTPVTSPLHSYLSDTALVFTNIPYTIRFRLHVSNPDASSCFYADTTAVKTIYVTNTQNRVQCIFTGNGNWTDSANWSNNQVPPSPLPFNYEIIISPTVNGSCILNINQVISPGAKITVAPGAKLIIQGELKQEH